MERLVPTFSARLGEIVAAPLKHGSGGWYEELEAGAAVLCLLVLWWIIQAQRAPDDDHGADQADTKDE